ncbi:MAG: helix-turn-helix domain-containing protein [Bacilli bacterium]|nr:helix-turn-helix domain-containing protein [Bacilli bacterium]MDY5058853.1 helix-turn-helix domain-containing protein [Bacilli bacterium]
MSVFKIEKNKDYTIMSNYHLRDRELSYKAKGLLSFMLSLPEDWDYSLNGLCAISKESKDGIRSILKELQEHHYIEIEKVRGDKGYFEYNYLIYEIPHFKNVEKNNPGMENPYMDNPDMETTTQINTNKINTNKQIDKDDKTISSFFIPEEHNILTLELINRGYINENDIQIFYYDNLFETLLKDNNSYKDLVQIIHYIVPRVIERKFKDEDGNFIENKFGYFKNAIISNINRFNIEDDDLWENRDDLIDLYNEITNNKDDFER